MPQDAFVADASDVVFPSRQVLFQPSLQGVPAVLQECFELVDAWPQGLLFLCEAVERVLNGLHFLLLLLFPLQGDFLDVQTGLLHLVFLVQVDRGIGLYALLDGGLFGFEEHFLAAQLELVVECGEGRLLLAAGRMELSRQPLVGLVEGFGGRFVAVACRFQPLVIVGVECFQPLHFGGVQAHRLFVKMLYERLVFGGDLRVLRCQDALFLHQPLPPLFPFFFFGRAFHQFFHVAAAVFVGFGACLLQVVVQDGQPFLQPLAALA